MQLVYFGKKDPKVVEMPVIRDGRKVTVKVTFAPFHATEVEDDVGASLLRNAGDIFKRYDVDRSSPDPEPVPQTNGYVGDAHAAQLPSLEKQVEKETKAEEGKDVEDVIAEEKAREQAKKKSEKAVKVQQAKEARKATLSKAKLEV